MICLSYVVRDTNLQTINPKTIAFSLTTDTEKSLLDQYRFPNSKENYASASKAVGSERPNRLNKLVEDASWRWRANTGLKA